MAAATAVVFAVGVSNAEAQWQALTPEQQQAMNVAVVAEAQAKAEVARDEVKTRLKASVELAGRKVRVDGAPWLPGDVLSCTTDSQLKIGNSIIGLARNLGAEGYPIAALDNVGCSILRRRDGGQ